MGKISFYITLLLVGMFVTVSAEEVETSVASPDSVQTAIVKMLEGQQLGEVVVKGTVPTYKLTGDGVQINVQGTPLNSVGTAEDVLRHIPGLQKADAEKYSVFGAGEPVFYVDGRQLRDLSELSQLKSQDIANVTMITNPGAKYDASVVAVVKIKTVSRKGEGFSLDEKFVWGQSSNTDVNEQLNINYRHKGLDVFGMFNYMKYATYDHADWELVNNSVMWRLVGKTNSEFDIHRIGANAGLNYVIDAGNSVGVRYILTHVPHREENIVLCTEAIKNGVPYDKSFNIGIFDDHDKPTQELNAYYNGKLSGWGIDFNASWWHNDRSKHGYYQELNEVNDDRSLSNYTNNRSTLLAVKLIINHSLFGGNLSFGAEYTDTKRKQENMNPEGYIKSSSSTQRNHAMAPFVEYVHPLSFGSVSAGLRYEHYRDEYYNGDVFRYDESRTYDHIFPHLSVQAKLGRVNGTLSYGVSVSRPTYKDLSEEVFYVNQFTLETGYSRLKPAMKHTLQLQAMWKTLTAKVGYTDVHDAILYWMEQSEDNSAVSIMSRRNHDRLKYFNVSVVYSPQIGVWRPQFMAAIKKQWLTLQTTDGELRMNRPLFMFQSANTYRLAKTLAAEQTLRLMSKGDDDNVEINNITLRADASMTKTFLDERLSVRLAVYDIFHSRPRAVSRFNDGYLIKHKNEDSRSVELTLRYTYNAAKSKYRGTGAGNDEKRRL